MPDRPPSFRSRRGTLLIVAMLLSAVIGISIVSFLNLGRTGMEISNRALYHNGAINLAENGLEHAVYAVNKAGYDWSGAGWSVSGGNARQKWTGYPLGSTATGEVRAIVYNYAGAAAPKVVSRALVTLGGGTSRPIEKWIEVQLRKTSRFANGLVAKQSITFSGNNASVDSWNSDPDNNPATAPIGYSAGVRHDNGSVGCISVSVSSVLINQADIWGFVATGGALPSVGTNGLVGPFGTPAGTMDSSRVSTDFTANFDPVAAPAATYNLYGGAITTTVSLPRATDVAAADGYTYIRADSINFTNKTVTITGKVILELTNTLTSIDIGGGSGALNINAGAELQVYAAGDVKIAGQGLLNGGTTAATASQPVRCQIYGTKTAGVQDIQIAGNGVLSAVVYAPQGSVKINGNGDVCGSIVANDITCVGNAFFHYDESLANFGGNNPYRVSRWRELTTAADRSAYAGVTAF